MSASHKKETKDPMSALCRKVFEMTFEDLPASIVNRAKHHILDAMAVIIGGSALDGVPNIVNFVKDKGGKPESLIPFYGGIVPASEAALAIGTMARAMDLGPVHEEAAHNSEYTLPALLAATGIKETVSGKDLITAFILGQEVLIRIGMAYKTISEGVTRGRGGGHYIFGVTAAVGKLLGLDFDTLENAQGIARGKTQPHDLAMSIPPTLMLRVHHGLICRDAIECCLLADIGITGPRHEILSGPKGYLGFAQWRTDPDLITAGFGEQWEMTNVMMKTYASCKGTHTAIEGIIDLMERHTFNADDIAAIHIDVSTVNWNLTCIPKAEKWNPQTISECQFSLPYTVATAAYQRKIFLDSFTPEARSWKDVRNLMTQIRITLNPNLPPWGARLETILKDGRTFSGEYVKIKGHPQNPFTEQELINKFMMCVTYSAYPLKDDAVESVKNALLELEKVDDVKKKLIIPLTPR